MSCQPLSVTPGQKRVRGAINFSSSLLWHANGKKPTTNGQPPHLRRVTRFYVYTGIHCFSFCLSQLRFSRCFFYTHRHISSSILPRDTFFSHSSFCPLSQLHFHYIPSSAPVPFSFLFPPLSLQRRYVLSENSKITRNVNSRISDKRARRNKWASNRGPAERQRRFENQ